MSTKIEWVRNEDGSQGETWNPVLGCERVSPGCDNCYAIRTAHRWSHSNNPKVAAAFADLTRRDDDGLDWTGRVRLLPDRLDTPLHWRKPRHVFVNSQADLFHQDVPDEFIGSVFEVMAKTPQHTYQILTKRHGRMRSLLSKWAEEGARHDWAGPGTAVFRRQDLCWVGPVTWPLPNVWLGVSVEDQKRADLRIPALLDTPAAVRFLSCEPLLGPVDLGPWTVPDASGTRPCVPDLHWVIVGGESGYGARPMHPDWARQLREQCQDASVPFFFKQWGEWAPVPGSDDWRNRRETDHDLRIDGYHWPISEPHGAEDGTEVIIRRVSKKAAGRELDGVVWDEYPAVVAA